MPLVGTNGTFILAWPTRLERDVERQPDRSGLERDNGDKAGLVQAVVDQGTRDWTVLVGDVPRVDADRVPLIQCYRSIEVERRVGGDVEGERIALHRREAVPDMPQPPANFRVCIGTDRARVVRSQGARAQEGREGRESARAVKTRGEAGP